MELRNDAKELSKSSLTLLWKLRRTLDVTSTENVVDTFVAKLFSVLGFDEAPYLLDIKPPMKATFGNKEFSSTPDFTIALDTDCVLEIIEDKTHTNDALSSNRTDPQVCGEMIVFLVNQIDKLNRMDGLELVDNEPVYPIRSIKIRSKDFTFYASKVKHSYLSRLMDGNLFEEDRMIVSKWPIYNIQKGTRALDFSEPTDRVLILKILQFIYKNGENLLSQY